MKANEYFKKHGYEKCKSDCESNAWLNTAFWVQLKSLIASHELVEEYGGLERAKDQAEKFRLNTCLKMHGFMCRIIADVESY